MQRSPRTARPSDDFFNGIAQKKTLSSAWQKVTDGDEHGTYAKMLRHESRKSLTFEKWQKIDGERFARPRWLSIFHFLVLPLFIALFITGVIGLGISVVFFSRGNIGGGFGALCWFCFCLFSSTIMCWQAWYSWKSRRSPLAVITSDGIYLPFKRPEYVAWDEVQAVGAFYLKGTAFLDLTLNNPRRTFGRRRGWWHGPWRDRVTLRIETTSNPLLQAARDAHNRSLAAMRA